MSMDPREEPADLPSDEPTTPAGPDAALSRRRFMQGAAALAASVALPAIPGVAAEGDASGVAAAAKPSTRPNIVLLITDQERYPQHWPEGWADRYLPNRRRMAQHALTFERAFCAASMCSPSRASLFTGLYPAQHGVTQVIQTGVDHADQKTLQPRTQNLARMLASAGYDVQYRGKWHMSKDPTGTLDIQSPRDMERYGFRGWLPPDGGQDQDPTHFGGGDTDYDAQYAAQAAAYLRAASPKASRPFALIVALVNPHDIMAHPAKWDAPSLSDIPPFKGSDNYGADAPGCLEQDIDLPSTVDEETTRNFKPAAQARSVVMWADGLGPLHSPQAQLDYVTSTRSSTGSRTAISGRCSTRSTRTPASATGRSSSARPTTARWGWLTAGCARRDTPRTRRRSMSRSWSRTRRCSRSRSAPVRWHRSSTSCPPSRRSRRCRTAGSGCSRDATSPP